MTADVHTPLSRWQVLLMAFATGVAVASNYYAQPLLHTIAGEFGVSFGRAGMLVTAAQLSYGVGVVLLVPLGDMFERRRLIVVMSLLSASGLVVSALSHAFVWLLVGTAITGLFSVVAQEGEQGAVAGRSHVHTLGRGAPRMRSVDL